MLARRSFRHGGVEFLGLGWLRVYIYRRQLHGCGWGPKEAEFDLINQIEAGPLLPYNGATILLQETSP